MRGEKILAPEVGDDSLLDLIADAKGLDQPEVLVLAVGGLDGAQEQAHYMTLHIHEYMDHSKGIFCDSRFSCGTTFCSDSPDRSCVFNGLGGTDPSRRANMR